MVQKCSRFTWMAAALGLAMWVAGAPVSARAQGADDETAAESARTAAINARNDADLSKAKAAAPDVYGAAADKLTSAERFADAKQYAKAVALYKEAAQGFAKAKNSVGSAEVDRLMRIAQANNNAEGASAARDALQKVLLAQPDHEQAIALLKKVEAFLYFTNSLDMKFGKVGPGKFMMGSPVGQPWANEQHAPVELTRPVWIGTTEVTQAQFEAVMGYNPSLIKQPNLPVVNVSWLTAREFCEKLGRLQAERGKKYRLPAEVEWEYACKAGTDAPFAGNGKLDDMGWHLENSDDKPHPVASKKPNAWGLYDMHGNVAEWCADTTPELKPAGPNVDPVGARFRNPQAQDGVAIRGGSYNGHFTVCRSAARAGMGNMEHLGPSLGFRVVLEAQ